MRANIQDIVYVAALTVWVWCCGYQLTKHRQKKWVLFISAIIPVIGLFVYKYAGFFGCDNLIMPLGISFYTFKGLSYLFDLYQDKYERKDLITVFDYMVFFPVFMAGPINRAQPFFEQLEQPWVFDYKDQKNGFVLAMLGLFEKLVIADQLAAMVKTFLNPELTGWYTVFGVFLYAFHIYADFDAYSNVAVGIARMMGFHIERNFHSPYLSASLSEFWKRWHISLSSWLRDFIYIPLGGNRKGELRKAVNILIVFIVSGLWHGSTGMFLIWGVCHAVLSILESYVRAAVKEKPFLIYIRPILILINFVLVALLWVFFRSSSLTEAMGIFERMKLAAGMPLISAETAGITVNELNWTLILIGMIIITDVMRYFRNMIEFLSKRFIITRWVFYTVLIVTAIIFGVYGPGYHPEDFIYVTF